MLPKVKVGVPTIGLCLVYPYGDKVSITSCSPSLCVQNYRGPSVLVQVRTTEIEVGLPQRSHGVGLEGTVHIIADVGTHD